MLDTATTSAGTSTSNPFNNTPKSSTHYCTTIKKLLYFCHFILIAIYTTFILVKYPQARTLSFTMVVMIVFGYMAVWTVLVNFVLLSFKKENWAVMFDRLLIKFLVMLYPITAVISYVKQSFLHINEISYFALYMTIVSCLLILYEIYSCTFDENQHPQYIFQKNDLTYVDQKVWSQRIKYNQNLIKNGQHL